ncbi:hypothetical protein [Pseudofrankia sp. DC12]|uniref:hypothetical protein n=1 Tax=Pseudofrankia sp. DC12 TaxID=683315 RepID=UPI0005F803F6|nr:hypothetical protein [Pseudofrankia sp. DC12]
MSLPDGAPRVREVGPRPRGLLVAAGALAAAGVAAVCVLPRVLGAAYPPWSVPVVTTAVLLLAGVVAGQVGVLRRQAEQALLLAADVAAFALVGVGALMAAVQRGRGPAAR